MKEYLSGSSNILDRLENISLNKTFNKTEYRRDRLKFREIQANALKNRLFVFYFKGKFWGGIEMEKGENNVDDQFGIRVLLNKSFQKKDILRIKRRTE